MTYFMQNESQIFNDRFGFIPSVLLSPDAVITLKYRLLHPVIQRSDVVTNLFPEHAERNFP